MELFKNYLRKPIPVQAVKATKYNLSEIAEELDGVIRVDVNGEELVRLSKGNLPAVYVDVYPGNWVVRWEKTDFVKIYDEEEFQRMFTL